MIKLWHSFSCNNSASYRLIARFDDARVAAETAAELAEFFAAQERLGGHRYVDGPLSTLSRTYGFDWLDGSSGATGPEVVVEDRVLIVHHPNCLGLGPGVPAYLVDRGGRPERESSSDVHLTALFRAAPGLDPQLDEDLALVFGQPLDEGRNARPWKAPWVEIDAFGRAACYRDAGVVGLWFPTDAEDIASFKRWLASHGIAGAVIRIEEFGDEDLLLALATARCTSCAGALEYLDPRLHDIETPQLVCTPCGGLYELSTFLKQP